MPQIARMGDAGSHGGTITTASSDVKADGLGVARIGDTYNCTSHGPNPITSGSTSVKVNGLGVAFVGSTTTCGATITAGSPTVSCS